MKKIIFVLIVLTSVSFGQKKAPVFWFLRSATSGSSGGVSTEVMMDSIDANTYPTNLTQGYQVYKDADDTLRGTPIQINLLLDSTLQTVNIQTPFKEFPFTRAFIIDSVGGVFSTPFANSGSITMRIYYNDSLTTTVGTSIEAFAASTNTRVMVWQGSIDNATVPANNYLIFKPSAVGTACGLFQVKVYGRLQ